ncbi:MAG: carboxylesterase family protein [Myxococcota bacterium]|nr:carboxylesterase family protein [Myxococcota bacterium]
MRVSSLVLGLILLGCGGAEMPPEADPASRRTLVSGDVVGYSHPDRPAHVWKGIPFAKPPTAQLRWRAPVPPERWEGVRQATVSGNECVQLAMTDPTEITGDEDCLVLDVYAPRFAPDAVPTGRDRKPVMVFIHGGGNSIGSAVVYDASRLAVEGDVIVIPIQYRLGVLGWLSHPALRAGAATADDASGNFGTLDTIRALEWVRDNVARFGGDPDNVTIFGESAGGINVFALLLSPRANGLFHRAISQSGILMSTPVSQAEAFADDDPRDAGSGEFLLRYLVHDGTAPDREAAKTALAALGHDEIEAYLRGKSTAELLAIFQDTMMGGMYFVPQIFRDGHVIRDAEPLEAFADPSGHNAVPTIAGTNREETKLFALAGSPNVSTLFGLPTRVNDQRGFDLEGEYGGLLWKAQGSDEPMAALRRAGREDIWSYRFDWDEEGSLLWLDLSKLIGASHAVEMLFVFGFTDLGRWTDSVFADPPSATRLSEQMRSYWTGFARTGNPGSGADGTLTTWEPWSDGRYLLFDSADGGGLRMADETATVESVVARLESDDRVIDTEERCALYRGLVLWSGAFESEDYEAFVDGACKPWPLDLGAIAGN